MASSGITGFITYKVANRQVASSEQMTREERDQDRLVNAYTSIMQHVQYQTLWVTETMTRVRSAGDEGPPPPYIDHSAQAFASLVASGEVGHLLDQFNSRLQDFRFRWNAMLVAEQRSDTPMALQREGGAEAVRAGFTDDGDDVVESMRKELGAVGQLPRTPDAV